MKELARAYFLEKNCNCAESVLRAANDTYELGITPEDIALISGFGGGMGCGKACGALCGGIAAMGKAKVQGNAHVTEGFREACAKFATDFECQLGGTECKDLKPKYFTQEARCSAVVEAAAELLDGVLGE
ncbi:MAG: C-GCAxxG-C-C family (seleno)protein [Eubacteriales bacterium]